MPKAIWKNTILAESNDTIQLEGTHYFPAESVNHEYLEDSDTHSICPWKGRASYYHVVVDGERSDNAAWHYPEPSDAATDIKDHVAFWRDVEVVP